MHRKGQVKMETRRFGLADVVIFLAVLAVAGGARVWYLYDQADWATKEGPVKVQDDYSTVLEELAENVRSGNGFVSHTPLHVGPEVTAHTSPGYPYLLAGVAILTDDWVDDWRVVVRWLQCSLGTLTAGLYFLFARRAFQSLLVGALAGFLCALHPFWVINTAAINDGVLASFLLAVCLFLGTRGSQVCGPTESLLFGLGLAALALVRAPLLPFAVVAMLWFLSRCRFVRRGWLCGLLAFLGFVNGLVPWTLRNVQQYGDVIPIVDSAYLHLRIGNLFWTDGGPAGWTSYPTISSRRGKRVEEWPADLEVPQKIENQKDRYNQFAEPVLQSVQDDPAGTVQRRLQAGLAFVFGSAWFLPQNALWGGNVEYVRFLLYSSLLAMLLLALLGWRWSYGWRQSSKLLALAFVWIPIPYLLSHAEFLFGPRLPLDGVLLCYAAFALGGIIPTGAPGGGRALLEGPPAQPNSNASS
jgi:hypothetical protein